MPNASSNSKEPEGMQAMSIAFWSSPSFIKEPFPNCFSIWLRAASSASSFSLFSSGLPVPWVVAFAIPDSFNASTSKAPALVYRSRTNVTGPSLV